MLSNATGDSLGRRLTKAAGGYFFPKPSLVVFEKGHPAGWAFRHTADTNRKEAWLLTTVSFTQLSTPVSRGHCSRVPPQ